MHLKSFVLLVGLYFCFVYSLSALTLYFKDGTSMECESAFFEGEFVRVKIPAGELRIPVAKLSKKTFDEMIGEKSVAPQKNESQPIPKSEVGGDLTGDNSVVNNPEPNTVTKLENASKEPDSDFQQPSSALGPAVPSNWKLLPFKEIAPQLPDTDPNIKVIEEEITLSGKPKTGLEGDKVVVRYRIAMNSDGKTPGPRADQLLFYAPYINDSTLAKGRETAAYTDLLGFTVFSFRIKTNLSQSTNSFYWLPEGGWFELVFEAAEKIRKKHGLKDKRMFLWGNSSGAGMAQRLALMFPDKFSAVGLMGGSGYAPVTKATGLPWLIGNTTGASEQEDNLHLLRELQRAGDNAVYARTPPNRETRGSENFYHTAGALAISLAQGYFWDLYQKMTPEGTSPPLESWPVLARSEAPYDLYEVPPGQISADWLNGRDWFRIPGSTMAFFWCQRPPVMKSEKLLRNNAKSVPLMVASPKAMDAPFKGIVITTTEFDFLQYPTMANDLSHWAEEGFVGVALRASKANLTKDGQEIPWKELLVWIKNRPDFQNLPIYLSVLEGKSLSIQGWNEASLRSHLKAVLISNLDADEPVSKNKEKLDTYSLGVPMLVAAHAEPDVKDKKKDADRKEEDWASFEKRINQRFQSMMNPPTVYLIPAKAKHTEIRQTYAIKKGAEFFQDYP